MSARPHCLAGSTPLAIGLLGDCIAGLLILRGYAAHGLLLHVPAVLLWAQGIGLTTGSNPWEAFRGRLSRHESWATSSGRVVAGAVIGLSLFPGLGTIGYTVALAATVRLPHRQAQRKGASVLNDGEEFDRLPLFSPQTRPLLDLEVQPLVDALRDPDKETRRAAIDLLGREPGADALRLLRELLTDSDPDIRGDAALLLSRYQDDLSQSLAERTTSVRRHPLDPNGFVALAGRYQEAAASGLFDESTSRRYLTDARAALRIATTLQAERPDLWYRLAHAQHALGETEPARRSLDRSLALDRDDADGYLLGMDIAFGAGDWTKLIALAKRGQSLTTVDPDSREVLEWWAA